MTDEPRTLRVPLDRLGGGPFEATLYADVAASTDTPTELGISTRRVAGALTLEMVRGGGAAIRLRPRP
jgi:hypothetical protein